MRKLMGHTIDLTNQRINKILVLKRDASKPLGFWVCLCDCGKLYTTSCEVLRYGNPKSCGCYSIARTKLANRKHGMKGTETYNIWMGMKARCTNKKSKDYPRYGGRGISVCDRWMDFENFYEDMGKRPTSLSLDRIDNNKGYYKENCKWSTRHNQSNNKRDSKRILWNGKDWCYSDLWEIYGKHLGLHPTSFFSRLDRWSNIEKALFTKKLRDKTA